MDWTIWLQRAISVNIEVTRDDDLAVIARLHFGEQLFGEEFAAAPGKFGFTRGRNEIEA